MNSHMDAGGGLQSADSNEYLRWAKASSQFHSHFKEFQGRYQGRAAGEPDSNKEVVRGRGVAGEVTSLGASSLEHFSGDLAVVLRDPQAGLGHAPSGGCGDVVRREVGRTAETSEQDEQRALTRRVSLLQPFPT